MTREFIDPENLMHTITIAKVVYSEFKLSRLDKKTVNLFDPITRTKVVIKSDELQKTPDINKTTLAFMRAIDIARLKGYNLDLLLQH